MECQTGHTVRMVVSQYHGLIVNVTILLQGKLLHFVTEVFVKLSGWLIEADDQQGLICIFQFEFGLKWFCVQFDRWSTWWKANKEYALYLNRQPKKYCRMHLAQSILGT